MPHVPQPILPPARKCFVKQGCMSFLRGERLRQDNERDDDGKSLGRTHERILVMLAGPKHGSLPAAARSAEDSPGEGPTCEQEECEVLAQLGELAAGVAEAEERRVLLPGGAGLARLAEVRSAGGCWQPLRVSATALKDGWGNRGCCALFFIILGDALAFSSPGISDHV